jgi:hypothetical protein
LSPAHQTLECLEHAGLAAPYLTSHSATAGGAVGQGFDDLALDLVLAL